MLSQEQDTLDNPSDPGDAAYEEVSDLSADEAFGEIDSTDTERDKKKFAGADDWNDSDDDDIGPSILAVQWKFFERSYKASHDLVVLKKLDGFNFDAEVPEDVLNAEEEERALHTDFGPNFIIVLTASAEALLSTDANKQGTNIDYRTLETQRGHLINWYNIRISSPYERSGDRTNELRFPRGFNGWRVEDQSDERHDSASKLFKISIRTSVYVNMISIEPIKILMAISTTPNACSETPRDRGTYIDWRL
ncbi:hypothetical protein IMSHALPRED_005730 [Imshaugia aleurites]|uniref:Uncharacterized protein n=1 Tax=Imshaugia aleurites TaxID=172621 RepID=A0A8H3FAZ5_9LECA|nr:hypothetical protein IMSHALPRED_005730 [Imshaugia aleurites]